MSTIWEGVCSGKYNTTVCIPLNKVRITQVDDECGVDIIVMDTNEAIDIAFAILKDLAPTLHETLVQLNVDKETKV